LVILGLLIGGILSGQSLIRAAELRSVTTEYQKYTTAVQTFRDKYFSIPGDMTNATAFWNTNPGCATATAGTGTQTCNGNGDGVVNHTDPGGLQETFYIWQHLANAGLVEGSYTGVGPNYYQCDNTRCPRGKLSSSYWSVIRYGAGSGSNGFWWASDRDYQAFYFGKDGASSYPGYPLITGSEAWNIDTKMDDGKPGLGKVMTFSGNGYTPGCAVNAATGVALADTEYTIALAPNAGYNLSSSTILCSLQFKW
jgi:hypothetical protein